MSLDWTAIATGLAAPVAVLLVKNLLDLSLGQKLVKWFHWVPVRGIFRDRPPDLSGKWEQIWGAGGSEAYANDMDRHSYTKVRQFGRYVYAEFDSRGDGYAFFGKIRGQYIIGEWCDRADPNAYFGAAQLRIISSREMEGCYLGHSKRTSLVGSDRWDWKKHRVE